MKTYTYDTYVGDFETTVYEGQTYTEVWASALVKIGTEDVEILNSIDETWDYLCSLARFQNIKVYYHNLKFDGSFWLDFLLRKVRMKQAFSGLDDVRKYWNGEIDKVDFSVVKDGDMRENTFKYVISDMGQWYSIIIRKHGHNIMFVDSLKLLPFTVKKIGEDFKTKHQKLDMEYKGYRYAGCNITEDEKKYIANDVLVIKEALEIMFAQGHNKMTIGSCCLAEFNNIMGHTWIKANLPDLSIEPLNPDEFGASNVDEYIRKSYHGGWCYVVKGKENIVYNSGCTVDVNSLYPSVMSGESGNKYPTGLPTFWKGNEIPEIAKSKYSYYFVRIKTSFKLKKNHLPTIQIKNHMLYKSNEYLETTEWFNPYTGEYQDFYYDGLGNYHKAEHILTLTETDFKLFLDQYDAEYEILDGCYFFAEVGIFDDYIEKYKRIKIESVGAMRQIAKLFLNNLYGKLASSKNSNYKVAVLNNNDEIVYLTAKANDKKIGYIPCGSAITSYARNFTIRHAQANYYGKDKAGFIYADTDSLHLNIPKEKLKEIRIHPTNFLCWKVESEWDSAKFIRQKTYIEHVISEDEKPVKEPYYSVKCAGMPDRSKKIFVSSITQKIPEDLDDLSEDEKKYISEKRTINDFAIGMKVSGKLLPKRITGGIILVDTFFTMR